MSVSVDELTDLYKRAKNQDLTPEVRDAALAAYEQQVDSLQPIFIGPTWRRNDLGKWDLPEYTLGWQIAGWCAEYLAGKGGQPWKFTKEQLRFILWWYAINEHGRFVHRTGVFQRLKGHGKDPILAVICLVEFVGPSRFSHWDEDGQPVGIPHPEAWVQIAAVAREQTKNTVAVLPSLMTDKLIRTYGIKVGEELFRADGGRKRLEAVTSNPRTLEGARSTFICLNETQHWVSGNKGIKMYETIDGNATKMDARYLAITNAYLPGEDSVAERMRDAYQKIVDGRALDVGFMYDSVEADPKTPLTPEALRIVLPKIRGNSVWLNVETIIQSVLNSTIAPSRSRRMYLNQVVAEEDAIFGEGDVDNCYEHDGMLAPKDQIMLGFDGGKTDDSTALIALRVRDMLAIPLGVWEKPEGQDLWEIDREKVDSAVHDAFRKYEVLGFYADVNLWESYIADWHEAYAERLVIKANATGNAIAWDMRQSLRKISLAHERMVQAIFDGKLRIADNPALTEPTVMRRHMLNARRHINNYGLLSFKKESPASPKKIDAYAALLLAFEALNDYRTRRQDPDETFDVWFL